MTLDAFNKRAKDAEDKLRALEAQINLLSSTYSAPNKKTIDDQKASWEVIYWGVKNRGNFVKLVLEEAGVPYKNTSDEASIFKNMRSDRFGKQTKDAPGYYHSMAVPLIKNGNFQLSQSIVCMEYLANKYGIRPISNENNALASMMANNCSDILSEFYDHRNDNAENLLKFVNGRFQIWLDVLQAGLTRDSYDNKSVATANKYYFDNKCTFADLAVFNILDACEEIMGYISFKKYVINTHGILAVYYNDIKKRKSIQNLMKKQAGLYTFSPEHGWDPIRFIFRQHKDLCFNSDDIIPDVVDNEPNDLLMMEYGDSKLDKMGTILTPTQVQDPPSNLTFHGCDNSKLYTVILTDPDARDRVKHEFREWVHHVRVNVPGNNLDTGGDNVIEYVGSGPPPNTGLHRYVWLIYEQANGIININKCKQSKLISGGGKGSGRRSWSARKFCKNNKLNVLCAGTYYNAKYDDFVPKLYAWLQENKSYKS